MKQNVKKQIDDLELSLRNGKFSAVRKPRILYKYYSMDSEFTEKSILGEYLYAANPLDENDIYDSSPLLIDLKKNPDIITMITDQYSTYTKSYINNATYRCLGNYIYSKWGIISLTINYRSKLMWSHYAKNDGLCIGFNVDRLNPRVGIEGPFQMIYRKELQPIALNKHEVQLVQYIMCLQKGDEWGYEKEWRYLVNIGNKEENRHFKYDRNAIRSIHFGYRFFDMCRRSERAQYFYGDKVSAHDTEKRTESKADRKTKILSYIMNNEIPIYIKKAMHLENGVKDYYKLKITEVNPVNKYIMVEKWQKGKG